MNIKKALIEDFENCKEALINSEIGRVYFLDNKEKVFNSLYQGIENQEVFVIKENDEALGFVRFDLNGMFSSFPYLKTIAVKEEHRNRGIGRKLLNFFEEESFKHKSIIFLLVSDFNLNAQKLYKSIGYEDIGSVPDLVKENISEILMMKKKKTAE